MHGTHRPQSRTSRLGRGNVEPADCPSEVVEVLDLAEQARRDSGGAFDVRRRDPRGRTLLDTDGVVKGWALQRAAGHLLRLPDNDVCLSGGGDVLCRSRRDSPPCRIGIEDPRNPHVLLATVPVRNGAVATSGTAHRGEHLVDARTGRHPTTVAQVTVVADSLAWADIDATAAYAQDTDAARWLSGRPGRTGLVVWRDGTGTTVPGLGH